MEAAAAHFLQLQLLPVDYFSQGPVDALNGIIDQLIPFYSVLVALIVASAHYHQWRLARRGPSLSPSDEELERQLWALERELLAAKRDAAAEQARKQQQQKQQQQQQKQLQQQEQQQKQSVADAHPLSEGSAAAGVQRRNFSGVWKSIPSKNVNYDEFLTVQSVPYLKRKIAVSTVVTHTIEHEGDVFKLEVQPLNMKTSFNIGGAPTVSYIGKKAFEDRMTWNDRGELVLVKTNAEDGTEITAVRVLSEDGRVLLMKQCVKNLKDGKSTHAEQTFEKS